MSDRLGWRLSRRRKALGWSMQDLADRIGARRQEVTALEFGRTHTADRLPIPDDLKDRVERALEWGETEQRLRPRTREPERF